MTPIETLRDGKVDEALAELTQKVRSSPADPKVRIFLFQLLAVQGQWERALTQLNVAGEMDPATLPMVQTYREAIRCEVLRAEIFVGKRSPLVFGEPEPWIARLMQANKLVADGQFSKAASLRDEALEAAPATSGSLLLRPSDGAPKSESPQPQTFEWIADADSRMGPLLEAILNGRYYWMPLNRIRTIEIDPPEDLRDVVWMPANFTFANGGHSVGLIPTRYPGSETNSDPLVRLARKTDWQDAGDGTFLGLGQRMLATDNAEFALMDIGEISLDSPDEPLPISEETQATDG